MFRRAFAVLFLLGFCTAIQADYFLIRVDLNRPLQKAGGATPGGPAGPGGPGGSGGPGGPGGSPLGSGGPGGPGGRPGMGGPAGPGGGLGMKPGGPGAGGEGGIYGGGILDKGEFTLDSRFVFSVVELTKREVLNFPPIIVDENNNISGGGGAGGPAGGAPDPGAVGLPGSGLKSAYQLRYLHPFGPPQGKTWVLASTDTPLDNKGVLFVPNSSMEFHRISEDSGAKAVAMPEIGKTYRDRLNAVKERTKSTAMVPVLKFALEHGLAKDFSEEMDKLAKADPKGKDPILAAYAKTKKDVEAMPQDDPGFASFAPSFTGFNNISEKHYHILHDGLPGDPEINEWVKHLELNFKNFFYWFTVQGAPIELPKTRMKVVLVTKQEVYQEMHMSILGSKAKTQGFLVPREKLLIICTKKLDTISEMLAVKNKEWTATGYDFNQILSGKPNSGYPATAQILDISYASALAILNKTLDREAIWHTIGKLGTIQLFYATGMFPTSVVLPEWLSEGLGSVFETPYCSPWMNFAGPNSLYLPKFRTTYKSKRNPREMLAIIDRLATGVVTLHKSSQVEIEQMRTDAWALVYFLVKKKTPDFLAYCKGLDSMPRDIPLQGKQMGLLFKKHFLSSDPDTNKAATAFALEWIEFMFSESLEGERFFTDLRRIQDEMLKTQNLDGETNPVENMLLRFLLTDTLPAAGNPDGGGPGAGGSPGALRPGGAIPTGDRR